MGAGHGHSRTEDIVQAVDCGCVVSDSDRWTRMALHGKAEGMSAADTAGGGSSRCGRTRLQHAHGDVPTATFALWLGLVSPSHLPVGPSW